MKDKGTNRQGERAFHNYSQNSSQNELKITERLRTRSISKSGDKLLTAQNSSDVEQKKNKTQNFMRDICLIYEKYVQTTVQCGYCQRWFHFKCENTTQEQVSKE